MLRRDQLPPVHVPAARAGRRHRGLDRDAERAPDDGHQRRRQQEDLGDRVRSAHERSEPREHGHGSGAGADARRRLPAVLQLLVVGTDVLVPLRGQEQRSEPAGQLLRARPFRRQPQARLRHVRDGRAPRDPVASGLSPGWRNGRRRRLKPAGRPVRRGGSSPSPGTLTREDRWNLLEGLNSTSGQIAHLLTPC